MTETPDITWTDDFKKAVYPGRGIGEPLTPPARPPTRGKVLRDVTKAAAKGIDYWEGVEAEPDLLGAIDAAKARIAKPNSKATLDLDVEAVTFHMLSTQPHSFSKKPTPSPKIARLWYWGAGVAFAVEAMARAWGLVFTYASSKRVDGEYVRSSEPNLKRSDERVWRFDFDRDGDPFCLAFKELRGLLTLASEEDYTAALEVGRRLRPDAPLGLRLGLDFLLPTEGDWAREDAEAFMAMEKMPRHARLLAGCFSDPNLEVQFFAATDDTRYLWMEPMLDRHGLALAEPLCKAYWEMEARRDHSGFWNALEGLATMKSPVAAEHLVKVWLTGDSYSIKYIEPFFQRYPQLGLDALRAASSAGSTEPRLTEKIEQILKANPALDPDVGAVADDDSLPSVLREDNDGEALPLEEWDPGHLPALHLNEGDPLGAGAVARLGRILRDAEGKMTPAVEAIRAAIKPEDLSALGLALWAGWKDPSPRLSWRKKKSTMSNTQRTKWVNQAMGLIGDDAVARAVGREIRTWSGTHYHLALASIRSLQTIGTDTALRQIQDLAQRARSNGVKRAATAAIRQEAKARGISEEALTALLTPILELDTPEGWVLDYGSRRFQLTIDATLSAALIDDKGKTRKSLPRPNASDDKTKAAEAKARWKDLKKSLAEIKPGLMTRLERALIDQDAWSNADWHTQIAQHPLVAVLGRHLVWADATDTFSLDAAGHTLDAQGNPMTPQGDIRLAHPALLSPEALDAWSTRLDTLTQPFYQLDRPHFSPGSTDAEDTILRLSDIDLPPRKLRGLIGGGKWQRGPVVDNGFFESISHRAGDLEATLSFPDGINVASASSDPKTIKVSLSVDGEASGVAYSELLLTLSQL